MVSAAYADRSGVFVVWPTVRLCLIDFHLPLTLWRKGIGICSLGLPSALVAADQAKNSLTDRFGKSWPRG
jgi:hypothetical protein